ncbi:Rap1a/Tai family immunity protein [Burkholderia gladioli]
MKRMCIPNDFTVAQSERILRNYMDAHPEKWGDGMRSLFDAAYAQAFPCK